MTEPFELNAENKLNDLNKKIAEIKKKIQLSEGQRKANFEEFEAKRQKNAEKIASLKQTIKQLYAEYTELQNNGWKSQGKIRTGRKASGCEKKRNLEETIGKVKEDNVRLRKKRDLIKYQRIKRQQRLSSLMEEYGELISNKMQKIFKRKIENPLRNRIVKLEVRLEHVKMMRIKANVSRMKYRSTRTDLKEKAVFYASCLRKLEEEIREQENEIKRLQNVKKDAFVLKNNMQENLIKEEIDITNCSKERDSVLQEYRQRVQERKLELERLEKVIFYSHPRDNFDTRGKGHAQSAEDITKDEVTRLEEAFAKLRSATGASRSEDVLNRFLGQQETKDNLQKMRVATEREKMSLEKQRQQLIAEMENKKFSETRNAELNAEKMEELTRQIGEQRSRRIKVDMGKQKTENHVREITATLLDICNKFRDIFDTVPDKPNEMENSLQLIHLMNEKVESITETVGGLDKYLELLEDVSLDKQLETISVVTTLAEGRTTRTNGGQLFPRFPHSATPATMMSEDEEDVSSRHALKRQAQQLVDIKSRRKGFTLRR